MQRRRELEHGRVADHDLGTEADPGDEARADQPIHVRRGRACERGKAEDREIELIGEAAAVAVAEPSPQPAAPMTMPMKVAEMKRAFSGMLDQPLCTQLAQYRAGKIDIETIENMPAADQPEQTAVKGQDRQSIEAFGGGIDNGGLLLVAVGEAMALFEGMHRGKAHQGVHVGERQTSAPCCRWLVPAVFSWR